MDDDQYRLITELQVRPSGETLQLDLDFENKKAIEHLRALLSGQRLTLVLGAGISIASGILPWHKLISKAASIAFPDAPEVSASLATVNASPLMLVRFLEDALGNRIAFRSALVRAMYEQPGLSDKNVTLDACARLVAGMGVRVVETLTYNFDDLFELKLRSSENDSDLKIVSIFSEQTYRKHSLENAIRVYHPHGFLPSTSQFQDIAQQTIVFSEREFHSQYFDHAFWANAVQMRLFSTRACLFVGVSFSDPNLRRLLDFTSTASHEFRHYAIVRAKDSERKCFADLFKFKDLNSLNVTPVWVREYDDIDGVVTEITR